MTNEQILIKHLPPSIYNRIENETPFIFQSIIHAMHDARIEGYSQGLQLKDSPEAPISSKEPLISRI